MISTGQGVFVGTGVRVRVGVGAGGFVATVVAVGSGVFDGTGVLDGNTGAFVDVGVGFDGAGVSAGRGVSLVPTLGRGVGTAGDVGDAAGGGSWSSSPGAGVRRTGVPPPDSEVADPPDAAPAVDSAVVLDEGDASSERESPRRAVDTAVASSPAAAAMIAGSRGGRKDAARSRE
jgi:hypothetical protein